MVFPESLFSLIIMCLVLFSFFLPPDSGERITIVVTVLLAFTVILQMLNQSMPRNSDSAPVLLIFYAIIMAESTFSLFTTCIVLVAHHRGRERWTTPIPDWIQNFMRMISSPLCVYQSNTRAGFRETENLLSTNCPGYKNLTNLMSNDVKLPANDISKPINTKADFIQHQKLDRLLKDIYIYIYIF